MENGHFRQPGNRAEAEGIGTRTLGLTRASRRAQKRILWVAALWLAGLALAGCKEDCSAAAKLGDFEFSQGNFVNAVKQYEKALRADANCGTVGRKLEDAKRRIAEERQQK